MHGLTKNLGTTVIYPEDRTWRAAGPLDENGKGIFVSLIYGDLETKGPVNFLMKYSAGVKAPPHTHSGDYYAVVVSGKFRHFLESENEFKELTPRATWFQKGQVVHQDCCVGPEDCVLNIFWPEGFDVHFVEDPKHPKSVAIWRSTSSPWI
jgi:anti-sigma factor ChrR (cupin superfamily)